jgi:hypothetical protein
MTDKLKAALADLTRTMKDIREGNTQFPAGRQDGDFFSVPMPGRSDDEPTPATPQTPAPVSNWRTES